MRSAIDWIIVVAVLGLSTLHTLGFAAEPVAVVDTADDDDPSALQALGYVVVPDAPELPAPPLTMPHESWCEPLELLCVESTDCPTAPDGTAMTCAPRWYASADASGDEPSSSSSRACVVGYSSREVREWRAARLRVLVDEICKRRDGCDPAALHGYLSALIMRESTWRPYKLHRLAADLAANAKAWERYTGMYRDNPAAGDPRRWGAGRGYFGANAAALLHVWDVDAIPETLCGEVEAVLVHLRTARKMWRRLDTGVRCDGREHHGTAKQGGVSWYDVSLANSGSNACPGTEGRPLAVRQGFERRAKSQGVKPYGRVTLRMLGREVPREEQARFASDVRRKMDAVKAPR